MASPAGDAASDDQHLFDGICFVLVGFDSLSEPQYRTEMVRRGGADAGRFGKGCTHVVTFGLVYDDPTCVAARAQGNKVVSELWVEDSLDRGVLADADKPIYWPARDLKGIPGSGSLHICLTGYVKYNREDIMKMVSLMGAQFSKPLVGNKVTHLICYKLEGEKYEFAKKLKIKLVNHRWLEDCLKSWEILPVDDYSSKSGWDLEIMEMQAKDSEDEAEGADGKPFNSRFSVKHTPNPLNSTGISAIHDIDIDAPVGSCIIPGGIREIAVETHLNTPGQIRKEDKAVDMIHDITAHGTPNTSSLATSSNTDGGEPIQTPYVISGNRENAAVRNLNSPNQIQEAKYRYGGTSTLDITAAVPGTPRSSIMAVAANHHLHASDKTPDVPNCSTDNGARKHLDNHSHIDVSRSHLTTLSKKKWSANVLDPSLVDIEQYQDNVATGNLVAVAGRSNVDDKLASFEVNLNSGGNAKPNNTDNLIYSRKILPRSLPPEGHSVHQMTSPQRAEEIALKSDYKNSSLRNGNQINSETADFQNLKDHENAKNVDGLDGAYPHKSKCLISPATLKSRSGKVVSDTTSLNFPSLNRLSDMPEPAISSCMGTNPTKASNVYMRKQPSSTSRSKRSRSRTSFKDGGLVNGVNLPRLSDGNWNGESPPTKSTPSQSAIVQDGKRNPGFSFENKNGEVPHASTRVNQRGLLLTHKTENACTKDTMPGISVHSSRNSQQFLCCGNDDAKMTDAPEFNKHGPAIDSNFNLVYDANVKANLNGLLDTSSNNLCETSCPMKVTTPRANAGAKRPYRSSMEVDGSVGNNVKAVVSESGPGKMIPRQHAGATCKNGSSSAAQCNVASPKKVPIVGVMNTFTKRQQDVHTNVNDAHVAFNLDLSKAVSQEHITRDPVKSLSGANVDQNQMSPKKVSNTRVKNTVVKRSRKSDTNMTSESRIDKGETVAVDSLFDDLFPSENLEDCTKKLSSSASADGCGTLSPKNVSTDRVRKAVAKRKIEAMKDKSASEHDKIGSAIVSAAKAFSSKRTEESTCNIIKVIADQDCQKSYKDGTKKFCKDTITIEKSEDHDSKLRCSKRNKTPASDHDKENRQENGNLSLKSNSRTVSLNSSFAVNSIHNSTDMLGENIKIKGNAVETLITLDPAWFILSGQRQQRRDYRSILRRLKGRVCRDSHNWSYKATHFISPNPLRTEKFFAAAAAGRWILKSDYLTSCNEAGKFLDEEPFEWFGKGLNDGETISYEAPRKWRVLKEQVGHGAFYAMQIIVYGQLICPSLDTVKCAVRAGDGTILATSPPYTRFLNSGVDFAVVSACMPSTDAWVQEFMSHDIPCVSADYLVEYVCKPGYPLDRHVLFNANSLANKSLDRLLKKQREVATNKPEASEGVDTDDLSCTVCGKPDRGEVMLICGDEEGAAGCGTGMHIDCSDPPLEAIPDDDWLCPKCNTSKFKNKPTSTCSKSRVSRQKRR